MVISPLMSDIPCRWIWAKSRQAHRHNKGTKQSHALPLCDTRSLFHDVIHLSIHHLTSTAWPHTTTAWPPSAVLDAEAKRSKMTSFPVLKSRDHLCLQLRQLKHLSCSGRNHAIQGQRLAGKPGLPTPAPLPVSQHHTCGCGACCSHMETGRQEEDLKQARCSLFLLFWFFYYFLLHLRSFSKVLSESRNHRQDMQMSGFDSPVSSHS